MTELSLSVPAYNPAVGVVPPSEGGTITVEIADGSVEIFGDPAGVHLHLDAGVGPLDLGSASLMLARDPRASAT
jgi:hypothetical protein